MNRKKQEAGSKKQEIRGNLSPLITFFFSLAQLQTSFSLAQRKEAKETSTLSKSPPIWGDLTAPARRSFIKVSSPHQRGGLLFCRLTPGDCGFGCLLFIGLRRVVAGSADFVFRLTQGRWGAADFVIMDYVR
ncbi:MAG: hypothetical protein IJ604_00320 [Prevotella sp.]|nr:hypothetical protein [Prevotella sp.]